MLGLLRRLAKPLYHRLMIARYALGGRRPWSVGYAQFKNRYIARTLDDADLMDRFARNLDLPAGFGPRLDERVVEYPWILTRLRDCGKRVLDAGSTLNDGGIIHRPEVASRELVVCTLAPEWLLARANVSYLHGDLRDLILRDACVDAVTCISTLEHVGMDNTRIYTSDAAFREAAPADWRRAVAEFRRVLRPGGTLLLTVPFGVKADIGWMQVYDTAGVNDIVAAFDGKVAERTFFRYRTDGWQRASAEQCADAAYFDIHSAKGFDPDFASAARAVACLRLERA